MTGARTLREFLHGPNATSAPAGLRRTAPAMAPTPTPAPTPAPKRSREDAIRTIAAASPCALPEGMVAGAIAASMTVEAFAIVVAEHVLAIRAEEAREAEIEAAVHGILSS